MLSQSGLSTSYWSFAISAACHIINRLPIPLLSHKTPWETLFQKLAALTHLRVFGYTCFPLLTPYNSNKLQPKTKPCIFLGYPPLSKGYICLDQSTNQIYTSRHVLFDESYFPKLISSITLDILHDPPTNACVSDNCILSLLSMHTCCHNSNSALFNSALPNSTLSNSDTSNSALSNSDTSNPALSLLPSIPPISHPNATIPTPMPLPSSPTYTPYITPDITAIPTAGPLPTTAPDLTAPVVGAPPAPTSTHSMQTQAKSGIFKPKVYYIAQPDYLHI